MGILKTIVSLPAKMFDFRVDRWLGWDRLKHNAQFFFHQTRALFHIQKAERNENFQEAIDRLELTEEMLQAQKERYKYLTLFHLAISAALLIYALSLIFLDNLMGMCMCLALMVFSLSNAFRYHFWYFQIQQKKLGCSLREWFSTLYRRRGKYE